MMVLAGAAGFGAVLGWSARPNAPGGPIPRWTLLATLVAASVLAPIWLAGPAAAAVALGAALAAAIARAIPQLAYLDGGKNR